MGDGEDVYMLMHKGHNENKYKSVYENGSCSKFHLFTLINRVCTYRSWYTPVKRDGLDASLAL